MRQGAPEVKQQVTPAISRQIPEVKPTQEIDFLGRWHERAHAGYVNVCRRFLSEAPLQHSIDVAGPMFVLLAIKNR